MVEQISQWFIAIGVPPLLGGALIGVAFLVLFKWFFRSRSDSDVDYGLQKTAGKPVKKVGPRPLRRELPEDVRASALALARGGNKIEAIKLVREATGLGLKESKDLVESLL